MMITKYFAQLEQMYQLSKTGLFYQAKNITWYICFRNSHFEQDTLHFEFELKVFLVRINKNIRVNF